LDGLLADISFVMFGFICHHPILGTLLHVLTRFVFVPFISPLQNNRPREQHHSEKGTTSRTRLAVAAEKFLITSKRRHALHADTPPRK
jgi:hypothetical protein